MIGARTRFYLDRKLAQLTCGLWLLRLSLLWLVGAPLYRTMADSPLLHGQNGDLALFRPGAELLFSLIDGQRQALSGLDHALRPLLMVALALTWVGSTYAWVATSTKTTRFGEELWAKALALTPKLAVVSIGSFAASAAIAYFWWSLCPLLGAALEPRIGERNTDIAQLLVFGVFASLCAMLCVIADVMRAVIIRRNGSMLVTLRAAAYVYGNQPLRVSCHAGLRFVLVLLCQVGNIWAIGHWQWLAQAPIWLALPILTTEAAALIAIRLRLGWIAWISEFEPIVRGPLQG